MNIRHGKRPRHAGFAIVPALFLLVVLGALGLVAVRVGLGQQQAVTMGLMQSRASAAADAGIQWGAFRALNGSCVGSTTLSLTEKALAGFTVVVTCTATAFTDGSRSSSGTNNSYVLNAAASAGTYGQPGYVHRALSATITDATS